MNARAIYQANYSDLRARCRFEKDEAKRSAKLLEVLKDRAFWFGDQYSKPASIAGQNVIRTLRERFRPSSTMEFGIKCREWMHLCSPEQQRDLRIAASNSRRMLNAALIRQLP